MTNLFFGQNYIKQFKELVTKKDSTQIKQLLKDWQKKQGDKPNYYSAAIHFNYMQTKGEFSTSTEKSEVTGTFNQKYLQKTFSLFNEAIQKFPSRLDFRIGKIYLLSEISDYRVFTDDIITAIAYSNRNKWTWEQNIPSLNIEEIFFENLQNFVNILFNTKDPYFHNYIRSICENILKYYPNNLDSYNNIATTYLVEEKPDNAISFLEKAQKISPENAILNYNLGVANAEKKDTKAAIKYYQIAAKFGDANQKEAAEKAIENLNK